jgi:hypothetical protein
MRARAVMYAALFTAGVEALAIYSTQEPESGRVRAAQTALAAPAPAVAGVQLPATRVTQGASALANPTAAAMVSATEKRNNTRPQFNSTGGLYLMVHQHKTVRRYRTARRNRMVDQRQYTYMNNTSGSNY